jgi:hypothetical protein
MANGQTIIKGIFGVVNVILFILGLAIFCISIWLLVNPDLFFQLVSEVQNNLSGQDTDELPAKITQLYSRMDESLYAILVIGILVTVASCLGCLGTFNKSPLLLNLYALLMSLLMIVQLAATVTVFVSFMNTSIDKAVESMLSKTNINGTATEDVVLAEVVDQFHHTVECCGWTDANNFATLPNSCCDESELVRVDNTTEKTECLSTSYLPCKQKLRKYGLELGSVSIVCIILELVSIVGACSIKKSFAAK